MIGKLADPLSIFEIIPVIALIFGIIYQKKRGNSKYGDDTWNYLIVDAKIIDDGCVVWVDVHPLSILHIKAASGEMLLFLWNEFWYLSGH